MNTTKPARWFRMYAEFATDPKVQMMPEAMQRRFIMMLCLRCANGCVTLHDEEVAFQLRISNEEWAKTKAYLVDKGLLDDDGLPTKWDTRQYASDTSAERVARHRSLKKQACNVTVTPPETEKETEKESKKTQRKRADKLTLSVWLEQLDATGEAAISKTDPILDYAEKTGIPFDYIRLAWRVFKARMMESSNTQKDWRASFRNYVRGDYLKLWAFDQQRQCYLTTAGKQAMFEMQAESEAA
jgi:hypothetical protein